MTSDFEVKDSLLMSRAGWAAVVRVRRVLSYVMAERYPAVPTLCIAYAPGHDLVAKQVALRVGDGIWHGFCAISEEPVNNEILNNLHVEIIADVLTAHGVDLPSRDDLDLLLGTLISRFDVSTECVRERD